MWSKQLSRFGAPVRSPSGPLSPNVLVLRTARLFLLPSKPVVVQLTNPTSILENVRCDRDLFHHSDRFCFAPTPCRNHSLLARVLTLRIVGLLAT